MAIYPKDEKTAALMAETIREVLQDDVLLDTLMEDIASQPDGEKKLPPYWHSLSQKDGITAMVVAQMLKAMAGDTQAFSALARYGFGEKVQIDPSGFDNVSGFQIEVINPEAIPEADPAEIGESALAEAQHFIESGEEEEEDDAGTGE